MFRHRDQPLTPPHSLRRRQQQQQPQNSEAGPPIFDLQSGHVLSGSSNQMLDLSICHPLQPFSNRFSVLATPPPSKSFREFPATNARRTRNSRGTKEAKKRRDIRRNRRKLAAQLLDQQLCQAVDETLTKANYPSLGSRPGTATSTPFSAIQTVGFPLSQPAYLSPMPPQLPVPTFPTFDLSAFPQFTTSSTTPPPLRTPTPFRTLPKWCPRIPSLTLGDVWRDSLPTFHDLSSLPEPPEIQAVTPEKCKDLQVWRPIGCGYGRGQSRFFPSRSLLEIEELESGLGNRVTVKLPPPVACRLHRSDNSVASVLSRVTAAATATFAEVQMMVSQPTSQSQRSGLDSPSAANGELSTTPSSLPSPAAKAAYQHTVKDGLLTVYDQEWQSPTDFLSLSYKAAQPPYEIDGREIELPYVHANSLTGYSNDTNAVDHLPGHEVRHSIADSGVGLPILWTSENRDMVGMNEQVIDHDIVAPISASAAAGIALPMSLPATPPATPPLRSLIDIEAILPIDRMIEADHQNSDAHYHSERALFHQTPEPVAQGAGKFHGDSNASSINIADFLKLGHAKHCWCEHCADHNVARDERSASIASSITLAGPDCIDAEDEYLDLSLLLNPSDSDAGTDSDVPEFVSLDVGDDKIQAVEDDGWLLFSHIITTKPVDESTSPLYLPSSPILHRHNQPRSPAPTVIITPSETCASDVSNDYVAVAASSGHELSPQRPRSAGDNGLALYGGCGFAMAVESSWRWGRESEEDWWDWAVEEEC